MNTTKSCILYLLNGIGLRDKVRLCFLCIASVGLATEGWTTSLELFDYAFVRDEADPRVRSLKRKRLNTETGEKRKARFTPLVTNHLLKITHYATQQPLRTHLENSPIEENVK